MADSDITSKDVRLNGVNSDTNLPLQLVYNIDVVRDAWTGTAPSGGTTTLKVANLPKGYAVKSVTMIVTTSFAGTGASVQPNIGDGTNTVGLGSTTAIAATSSPLDAGSVLVFNAAGGAGAYKADTALTLNMVQTVAEKALTAGAAILFVDLLPVDAILNKG